MATTPGSSARGSRRHETGGEPSPAVEAPTMRDGTLAPTMGDVTACFDLPIDRAAKQLGVGQTWLKHICRENGVIRWPYRKLQSLQNSAERLRDSVKHIDPRLTDDREKLKQWETVQRQIDQLTEAQVAIRGGQCAEKVSELYAHDALKAAARCGRSAKSAAKAASKADSFQDPRMNVYGNSMRYQQGIKMEEQSISPQFPSGVPVKQSSAPMPMPTSSWDHHHLHHHHHQPGRHKRQPLHRHPQHLLGQFNMPAASGVTSFAEGSGGISYSEIPHDGQMPPKRARQEEDFLSTAESPIQMSKVRTQASEAIGSISPLLGSPAHAAGLNVLDILGPPSPMWASLAAFTQPHGNVQTESRYAPAARSLFDALETPPSARVQASNLRPHPVALGHSSPRFPGSQQDIFATLQDWASQRMESAPQPPRAVLRESNPQPPSRNQADVHLPDAPLRSGRWTFGGSDGI